MKKIARKYKHQSRLIKIVTGKFAPKLKIKWTLWGILNRSKKDSLYIQPAGYQMWKKNKKHQEMKLENLSWRMEKEQVPTVFWCVPNPACGPWWGVSYHGVQPSLMCTLVVYTSHGFNQVCIQGALHICLTAFSAYGIHYQPLLMCVPFAF